MRIGTRLLIGTVLVSASGIAAAHHPSGAPHGSHGFVRTGAPVVVGHPHPHPPHSHVVVRRPIIVAPYPYYVAPYYGGSYYSDPGYAYGSDYAASAQPAVSDVYYYCPDSRQYYPTVPSCPSPWLKVMP